MSTSTSVILYIEGQGVKVFMSSAFEGHGHGNKTCELDGISYTMHAEDGAAADGTPVVLVKSLLPPPEQP